MTREALIVVDVQNDFCEGGALEVPNAEVIIEDINEKMREFSNKSKLVVATQDYHPSNHKSFASNNAGVELMTVGELNGLPQVWWPDHCIQGTAGAEFHPELKTEYFNYVVRKGGDPEVDSYSGFFDNGKVHQTELHDILQKENIDTVHVVGLALDYCVKFTAVDAAELGYKTFLLKNLTKGVNFPEGSIDQALQEMENANITIIE